MNSLLNKVKSLNNANSNLWNMIAWEIDNEVVGYISSSFCAHLQNYPEVFAFKPAADCMDRPTGQSASASESSDAASTCASVGSTPARGRFKPTTITFAVKLQSASLDERTEALNAVNADLRSQGLIYGWRDELLPVLTSYSNSPKLLIERAACPYYGVKSFGVHINGYVCQDLATSTSTSSTSVFASNRNSNRESVTHMWVAKRSANKPTWPGMLDHIVAGAQPYGYSIMENVVKECQEEASIPEALALTAKPTGAVSYSYIDEDGNLKRDGLYCFDLELPLGFEPTPLDGEVESFELKEVEWVLQKVIESGTSSNGYKPNCNLVLMDFFIR